MHGHTNTFPARQSQGFYCASAALVQLPMCMLVIFGKLKLNCTCLSCSDGGYGWGVSQESTYRNPFLPRNFLFVCPHHETIIGSKCNHQNKAFYKQNKSCNTSGIIDPTSLNGKVRGSSKSIKN